MTAGSGKGAPPLPRPLPTQDALPRRFSDFATVGEALRALGLSAPAMLAARYQALVPVIAGPPLGMLLAAVPAVLLGERAVRLLPAAWVHRIAAAVFAAIGVAMLLGVGA